MIDPHLSSISVCSLIPTVVLSDDLSAFSPRARRFLRMQLVGEIDGELSGLDWRVSLFLDFVFDYF
jgi:hypothetical protein